MEEATILELVSECPECGGQLYLSSCCISYVRGPEIGPYGFCVGEGHGCNTDNEMVECRNCDWYGALRIKGD